MKSLRRHALCLTASTVFLLLVAGLPAWAGDVLRTTPQDDKAQAEALLAMAGERILAGQFVEGRTAIGEALILYQELGDLAGKASCYLVQGLADAGEGKQASAVKSFEQSLCLLENLDDRFTAWMALWMLAEMEALEGRFDRAVSHHERALAQIEELKTSSEPLSLAGFKLLARVFGVPAEQIAQFDNPLMAQLAKPLLTHLAEAITRDSYGGALVEVGRLQDAEAQLTQAAGSSQLLGGMFDSSVFAHFGHLRRRQWRLEEAKENYLKALEGAKQFSILPFVRDARMEVQALGQLAEIELLSGHLDAALAWNDKALALVRLRGNEKKEASLLQERANFLLRHQRLDEAETTLAQALGLARKSGDIYRQGTIHSDLGVLEMLAGRYEKAAQNLETAIRLFREIHEPYVEASVWALLADAYMLLDDHASAAAALEKAHGLARESQFQLAEAMVGLLAAANRYFAGQGTKGDVEKSYEALLKVPEAGGLMLDGPDLALLRQALPLETDSAANGEAPQVHDPDVVTPIGMLLPAVSRFFLGKLRFDNGEMEAARDLWRQVLAGTPNRDLRAGLLAVLGASYVKEGQPEEALSYFIQAVDLVEHSGMQVEDLLAAYLGGGRRLYSEVLVDALARQGRIEEAFSFAERARARAFLQLLGNRRLRPAEGGDPQLVREAEALRTQILFLERKSLLAPALEQKTLLEELGSARRHHQSLVVRLKVSNPEYASVAAVETVPVADLQRDVPPGTTLVSYFISPLGTHAWVLDRETFHHVLLPLSAADLPRAVCWADRLAHRNAGEATERGAETPDPRCESATSEELYEKLIAPLQEHIRHPRLILVPHGPLHYLPFAALRDPKTGCHLVEQFTLTYLPSASSLRFLRGKETAVTGQALVLGNPENPNPNLTPLPFAEREAIVVARLLGTQPMLGSQATESHLRHLNRGVDLVHIAAHGLYEPANPQFSRVVLSPDPDDPKSDGNLEVHEILADLDLSGVNLVVLSACQTASGKRSGGDEIVGLTRALLYAGTPGVISTLWNIHDAASAILMQELYRHLLDGATAAEALRAAQLSLLRNPSFQEPYYWAAFSLTGDPQGQWQPPIPAATPTTGAAGGDDGPP